MRVSYKGHSFITEKVSGNLSKVHFKGLDVWFSYEEPIAICYPKRAIISDADFSSTTSRHVAHVKNLFHDLQIIDWKEFEVKALKLFSGEWND